MSVHFSKFSPRVLRKADANRFNPTEEEDVCVGISDADKAAGSKSAEGLSHSVHCAVLVRMNMTKQATNRNKLMYGCLEARCKPG